MSKINLNKPEVQSAYNLGELSFVPDRDSPPNPYLKFAERERYDAFYLGYLDAHQRYIMEKRRK